MKELLCDALVVTIETETDTFYSFNSTYKHPWDKFTNMFQ